MSNGRVALRLVLGQIRRSQFGRYLNGQQGFMARAEIE
jgi:hypothetical protein